jgi:3-isopropylmalate dehydratase small subunit
VARSFARIFFRNALNLGLVAVACPTIEAAAGDTIEIEPEAGVVRNLRTGRSHAAEPLPHQLMEIVEAGGLMPYLERRFKGRRQGPA